MFGAIVVRGNHDEAVGTTAFKLNQDAHTSIAWTRTQLSAEQRTYLAGLPLSVADSDCLYVHASASKPATFPYVHGLAEAHASLAATKAAITFAGHVHTPALYNLSMTGKTGGFIPQSHVAIPLSSRSRVPTARSVLSTTGLSSDSTASRTVRLRTRSPGGA